ncbi:TPA: PTS sugar transporter subunit IIA [Enterococcus faecium]|nr:PTS sugar transporter subunit IIA [Enterococcus faecium]HBL1481427.1 PTS sugar transporter subunit IIA [Enterococcus faecium]
MAIDVIVSDGQDKIKTYEEAIRVAGEKLVGKGNIDAKYIDACIEREKDFPTGLLLANGDGIAIPHGNSDLVNKDSISVIRVKNTVEFGRMEDKDLKVSCSLVFNLALASGNQHIGILRKLIGLFQDEEFVDTCKNEETAVVQKYLLTKLAE